MLVSHDHLAYRYEVLKIIGKGSFGQVRWNESETSFIRASPFAGDQSVRSQVPAVRGIEIGAQRETLSSTS